MARLQIPYRKVLLNPTDFEPDEFDDLLRRFIEQSRRDPIIIEVFNEYVQYLVFVREGMLYWAAVRRGDHLTGISFRDFFANVKRTQFPQIVVYQADMLLYHSLLVFFQKKPDLKVSSKLVDLDEILDKAEAEGRSCIVVAHQPGNLLMLRYQGGEAAASFFGCSGEGKHECNVREEFLVKVYTLASHRPFEINIFYDLVVTHSEDARTLPPDFFGGVSSFFLCQPPRLIVKLKNRPLKTYPFTGKEISIGRHQENDIVIDNLSVSRKHAVISATRDGYMITDLDSKNGTLLGGERITRAPLENGDVITIGKYQIAFQIPGAEEQDPGDMDQTVIIPNFREGGGQPMTVHLPPVADGTPRLFRRSNHEEYAIEGEHTVIGRDKEADVRMTGLLAPRVKAEIVRRGDSYIFQKVAGRMKILINGEEMDEKILEKEDLIAIGPEEFVFKM